MTGFDDIPKAHWIPEAIRLTAKPLVDATAKEAEDWEVVRRLLTDERMRSVWKELTRHTRDPKTYKSTDKFLYARQQTLKITMLDSEGKEYDYQEGLTESLVAFFVSAILNAIELIPTITREDVMAKRAELTALHGDLVNVSKRLRTWSNEPQIWGRFVWWANKNHVGFDLPGLAATLDKASEFL